MTSALQTLFSQEASVQIAVLVGSRAHQREHAASDWDIAIDLAPAYQGLDRLNELQRLQIATAQSLQTPIEQIDVIDLHAAGLAMREEVVNHGVLLKGDGSLAWSHFLQRTWRELEMFAWEQQDAT